MLSTLKSRLTGSLVSLILIFSLTPVSRAHPHHSYSHDDRKQTDRPDWMSALPDSVRLSELSIPGTHESLSRHAGFPVPLNLVKTQSMSLRFQLESGIRALDVRCAIVGNSFNIYHGSEFQHENFDGVLRTVIAFLQAHPGETVLMRVKEERTNDPEKFLVNFRETYWNNGGGVIGGRPFKYKDYIPMKMSLNPTLREMRGKIVILQDFARWQCLTDTSIASYGICYSLFVIQDEFKVPGDNAIYDKWVEVKKYLDRANTGFDTGLNRDTKFMNYLSGVGVKATHGSPYPYRVVSGHVTPGTGANRIQSNLRLPTNQWRDFPRIRDRRGIEHIYFEERTLSFMTLFVMGTLQTVSGSS